MSIGDKVTKAIDHIVYAERNYFVDIEGARKRLVDAERLLDDVSLLLGTRPDGPNPFHEQYGQLRSCWKAINAYVAELTPEQRRDVPSER